MKKKLRVLTALLLVAALTLLMSACGSKAQESPYAGKYVPVAGEMLGVVLVGEELEAGDMALTLESNGKGKASMDGATDSFKWSESDGKITIEISGETLVAEAGEDTLVFDNFMDMGIKMTFAKEGTDAANPEKYRSATAE